MKGRFSNGMDPQKLSQLDPKLREAYQRVMGTTIPQGQPPAPPVADPASAPTPTTPTEPAPTPAPASEPTQPEPVAPTPGPEPVTPPQTPGDQQREPFFIPQPPAPEPATPQPQTPPAGGSTPPTEPSAPAQQASSNFVQMNSEVAAAPTPAPAANFSNFATPAAPQAQTMTIKKKSGIMPILFGLVGVVFLVVYTLFWSKIFNFKLPFLP